MERIRELRNQMGISQTQLAVDAGIGRVTLNRMEQGKRRPRLGTLEKLADALDVRLVDLLEDVVPKKVQAPLSPIKVERGQRENRIPNREPDRGPAKGAMRLRSYTSCASTGCGEDLYFVGVSGLENAVELAEERGWEYGGAARGWICASCANTRAEAFTDGKG